MQPSVNNLIGDNEKLLRYCNPKVFPLDQDEMTVDSLSDPNLSCDWTQHRSDPTTSPLMQIGKTLVCEITICEQIRNPPHPVPGFLAQTIIHDPENGQRDGTGIINPAHSLIQGRKKRQVLDAIVRNAYCFDAYTPALRRKARK